MHRNQKSAPTTAGQPATAPPLDDIDLSAALPEAPSGTPPKRTRGRPRSTAPPPPRKYKIRKDKGVKRKPDPTQPPPAPIDIYSINIGSSIDNNNRGEVPAITDLKSKMTVKELKFLEIYLKGNISKKKAMIAAGYEEMSENYLYFLGSKIIEKHETQVGDGRILARAMGLGEVKVLQTLWELMQSKIERIRLDATMYLGKILGLTKEQIEGSSGITIIFEGSPGQTNQIAVGQPAQEQAPALPTALPYAGRVLQITR